MLSVLVVAFWRHGLLQADRPEDQNQQAQQASPLQVAKTAARSRLARWNAREPRNEVWPARSIARDDILRQKRTSVFKAAWSIQAASEHALPSANRFEIRACTILGRQGLAEQRSAVHTFGGQRLGGQRLGGQRLGGDSEGGSILSGGSLAKMGIQDREKAARSSGLSTRPRRYFLSQALTFWTGFRRQRSLRLSPCPMV